MPTWDAAQYLRFSDHRLRPAIDLIARIDAEPAEVWDLGCGTGNVTALLAARWPDAVVHGLDSSAPMLDRARAIAGIDWVEGDIATWDPPEPADLLFSNAALHWLGDHATLFPRLASRVRPGGTLAVQMPRNHGEPSHRLLADVARSPRWAGPVREAIRPAPVAEPSRYHDLLAPLMSDLDIWEVEYLQVLHGDDAVAEWTRGTAARPFLEAAGDRAGEFMAEYAARLREAYPPRADGTTLFPFRRLFIVGRRRPDLAASPGRIGAPLPG
jgi:trans-aconitate 2-methyltransferase